MKRRSQVFETIKALFVQGLAPHQIALALVTGALIGVLPMLGVTTLLCTAISVAFRVNFAAIQLANWIVYPLQLLLLIPFMRAGEAFFGGSPLPANVDELIAVLRSGPITALAVYGEATARAIAAWLLISPIAAVPLYFVLLGGLRRARRAWPWSNPAEARPR